MTYSRLIPHHYQSKRYRLFDLRTSVFQDPLDLSSLMDQCALITWNHLNDNSYLVLEVFANGELLCKAQKLKDIIF